jgi:long-chain acyl-CoA synthetase
MKFFRFLGFKKKPSSPWDKYYKKEEMDLEIPNTSLYEYFMENTKKYNSYNAIDYYGTKITNKELKEKIDACAKALLYYGIRKGDVVTICMPNTPEAIISFLAVNKIGAISNMVHPLSSENEIRDTLKETNSALLIVIDLDYQKIKPIIEETNVIKVVIAKASISMPFIMKAGYQLTTARKYNLPKFETKKYILWNDFLKKEDKTKKYTYVGKKNSPAVMIHSGGSTGTPKGIVLSNGNFITLAEQSKIVFDELEEKDKCLSIMPVFHGFGLGVCIYTPLCLGAECIVIPKFKADEFDKLLNKYKPEFVIGVPTLFEAMIKSEKIENLNYLKYVISGGDTLKLSLEEKINDFLHKNGANTRILQGYGMSESLAAVALEPKHIAKKHSVGIPFPSCYIGIFDSEDKEVPYGKEGEICISGPNVMLGYYNNEKETNLALHIHEDGNVWLHSGDLGYMDQDGFITYTSRLKRLIISSGYNVYPAQIEALLETHEAVMACSVVGVPHPYKVEVPKAYIVLQKGYKKTDELEEELKELCKKNLPKYAKVQYFEYRKSLPKTLVGKVDFKKLQQENMEKRRMEDEEK